MKTAFHAWQHAAMRR